MTIRNILLVAFVLPLNSLIAQDIQFSQFYTNIIYQNPAFAGSNHGLRGLFHQRVQWPSLGAKYTTSYFSADNYFENAKSGAAFYFIKDNQGKGIINTTEAGLQYAYEMNISSKFSLRSGLQMGYVTRSLDYTSLTFPDQYNDRGFNDQQTGEPLGIKVNKYIDLSAGTVLYADHLWIGVAAHHLNTPTQSFYSNSGILPTKLSITGGYNILLKEHVVKSGTKSAGCRLVPTIHYKMQGKSDQADAGIYFIYDQLLLGTWYRGIPVKHYRKGLQNNESIVLQAGWKIKNGSISYSYDFTVSKLASARTGGAHEINLNYTLSLKSGKKKPMKRLPCPDFYK